VNSIRRHDAKQKNVAAKSKNPHIKTLRKNKIPSVPRGASPVMRKMIEKARAKAESKAQQAEARGQRKNMEAESLEDGLTLAQGVGRTSRRSAKTLKKGVKKAVKGIRPHKEIKRVSHDNTDSRNRPPNAPRRKQKEREQRQSQATLPTVKTAPTTAKNLNTATTHVKMPRAKIKTVRLRQREKPPIQAASLQRVKIKKATQRKAKARALQRSIKIKDGKITVIAALAPKVKAIAKRITQKSIKGAATLTKEQATASIKSALKYKDEAQGYEKQGLDETLSCAAEGTKLFGKAAIKATQAAKEQRKPSSEKQIGRAGNETSISASHSKSDHIPHVKQERQDSHYPMDSHQRGRSPQTQHGTSLHRDKAISPRQKPTMQSAKTRNSIGRGQSQIKEKAQIVQSKQKQMPLKNRLAKRKQIKKAKLAQAQTRQKAAAAVKAAGKRALVMMKEVAAKAAAAIKSLIAALGGGSMMIVLLLLIFVIGFLAASPFGLFMSNDTKNGRPLAEVIIELDTEMRGSTAGTETEGDGDAFAGNWIQVIAVFAVRTTTDKNIALDVGVLDEKRVDLLREVLHDMNQVSTKQITETITDEQGNSQTVTKTVSSVSSKTAEEMADLYGFDSDQRALLDELLNDEYFDWLMELLGQAGLKGSLLSNEEIESIIRDLPLVDGDIAAEVVKLALSKLGTTYNNDYRHQEGYFDCSSFTNWVYKQFDIQLEYEGSDTAAYQGKWIDTNMLAVTYDDLQPGDLVFWSYGSNGRYKDIDHIAIYCGNGKVVDASKSNGKVVYRNIFDRHNQVMYGRPLAYGK